MDEIVKFVAFSIDKQQYALPLDNVERVIHVIEIIELPNSPEFIHGVINLYGKVIPVINIRARFGIKTKDIELSDQLIIISIPSGKLALLVDSTHEIILIDKEEIIDSEKIIFAKKYIQGVIKQKNGLVLINDVDKFLNNEEKEQLDIVLKKTHV
jgi:purine-binding chemotaxis protein CheW